MGYQSDQIGVTTLTFRSRAFRLLRNIGHTAEGLPQGAGSLYTTRDIEVRENHTFRYDVFAPPATHRTKGVILLFHGLNEKFWDKYLPWARELSSLTGKAVVLFPIAFHMKRAPSEWSNPRAMSEVAAGRKRLLAPVEGSSFVNAALSTRLQLAPERFLWSGLQTYYDVLQLVDEIRAGLNPVIDPEAEIGIFGYSIGAFLAEMLILENTEGTFSTSRAFLFCGGSTLSEMAPVSKYIIDSRASEVLAAYYGDTFDAEIVKNPPLRRLFERIQTLGSTFRSMLFPTGLRDFRLARLATVGRRLAAIVLKRDQVIPGDAVRRTLTDGLSPSTSPIVEIIDFPFDYTHEQPFPRIPRAKRDTDAAIHRVMRRAADHL